MGWSEDGMDKTDEDWVISTVYVCIKFVLSQLRMRHSAGQQRALSQSGKRNCMAEGGSELALRVITDHDHRVHSIQVCR